MAGSALIDSSLLDHLQAPKPQLPLGTEALAQHRGNRLLLPERRMARLIRHFREALWLALKHDVLNTAKAGAYDAEK